MTAYIIVGAIATWVLGWLWYQYLFPKVREEFGPPSARTFVITAVALVIFSAAVGTFVQNRHVADMADTLRLGFKIWLGFVLPVLVASWASTRQSTNVLAAGAGYWLVSALLLTVLASWMIL